MKKWQSHLFALLIPAFSLLLLYVFLGIFPFGERSLLAVDMYNQYISFFAYMKDILQGNHDIFYTFSKNLGGDMISIFSYYLMSPLNILFLLFPLQYFQETIMLLTLVKIGLAGVTMNEYLWSKKASSYTVIFSIAYALMAYMLVYQQNIMWLDGVILLPLVIRGIDRIFEGKSILFYTVFLGLSLMTNYYIGYMVCIFSVIYVMIKFIGFFTWKQNFLKIFGRLIAGSLLGGCLAAIVLVPTAVALAGGKATFDLSMLTLNPNFNFSDILSKFIIGSTSMDEVIEGLPNVYIGSFVLSCLFFYFLTRGIPLREKVAYLIGIGVIGASFYYDAINLVWHAFNYPAWFPYRYSFIFSFLSIVVAYEAFLKAVDRKLNAIQFLLVGAVWLLFRSVIEDNEYAYVTGHNAFFTMLFLLGFTTMIFLFSRIKPEFRKHLFLATLALSLVELTYNGYVTLSRIPYPERELFTNQVSEVEPITQRIRTEDDSFYRIAQDFEFNGNDPMLYGYNGLAHYSSNEETFVKEFLGRIGFRNNGNWAKYGQGNTLTVDSLLDVKYFIGKGTERAEYELLENSENINVYQNPYALPVGMMVETQVGEADLNDENPFVVQNRLVDSIVAGEKSDVLKQTEKVKIELDNAIQSESEYGISYEIVDWDKESSVTFTITVDKDAPYYAFFPSIYWIPAEMYVNDELRGEYFTSGYYNIVPLGDYEKDDVIKVTFNLSNKGKIFMNESLFYYEDMAVFERNYKYLSGNTFQVDSHSSSTFEGSVESINGKETLLFSIPYDEAWRVVVDGQDMETKQLFGLFLAVDLEPGEHEVTLKYIPKGWYLGLGITIVSLFVTVYLYIVNQKSYKWKY